MASPRAEVKQKLLMQDERLAEPLGCLIQVGEKFSRGV